MGQSEPDDHYENKLKLFRDDEDTKEQPVSPATSSEQIKEQQLRRGGLILMPKKQQGEINPSTSYFANMVTASEERRRYLERRHDLYKSEASSQRRFIFTTPGYRKKMEKLKPQLQLRISSDSFASESKITPIPITRSEQEATDRKRSNSSSSSLHNDNNQDMKLLKKK